LIYNESQLCQFPRFSPEARLNYKEIKIENSRISPIVAGTMKNGASVIETRQKQPSSYEKFHIETQKASKKHG
jgi:hypothetical protein